MRVNTTDLQNAFGKYLALLKKEEIIVVKNGKSVARLTGYTEPDHYLVHEEAKKYKSLKKISYEEYMALVESSDQRYELIDGEIYLLASPGLNHQFAVKEIAGHFYNYFKGKPCQPFTAPLDVRLSGYATKFEEDPNVVQPDVVVICDLDRINKKDKYEGTPSLIVEVLSPSTKGKDMAAKLHLYMRSGVAEYWIADQENKRVIQYSFTREREVENLRIVNSGETIKSVAFQDLAIDVQDIFMP